MKQVKRWRFYCDFCNKAGGSSYHMANHERGCTSNHDRTCGLCDKGQMSQQELPILIDAYKAGGIDKLREATEGCPACILTTIKACLNPKESVGEWEPGFDFKKELKEFWDIVNDANAGPGWEGE